MFDPGYNLLMAVKVIAVFILIYVYIPAQFIKFGKEDRFLDKLFVSLIHSNFITIVLVHFLVLIKLYETFSLFFCYFALFFVFARFKGITPGAVSQNVGMGLIVSILDMSEGKSGIKGELKRLLYIWLQNFRERAAGSLRAFFSSPFTGLFPASVVIAAAVIRFNSSIYHAAYAHIDSYSDLISAKHLGSNLIYYKGIYPEGYHAVITSIAKLTFIDPYWIVRFIGPLAGVLLVLSVYYFSVRITKSYLAGLLSLFIFGLVTSADFPSVVFRQTTALPQEYGAIFVLPGLYFLWQHLCGKGRIFLLLYAEAMAVTLLVHSYAGLYLVIWSGLMLITAILVKKLDLKHFWIVVAHGSIAVAVSLVPIGIGLAMGRQFHKSSADFIKENLGASGSGDFSLGVIFSKLLSGNVFLDVVYYIGALLIISMLLIRKRDWILKCVTLAVSSLLMLLLYRASELNLPQISEVSRTGVFLSLMLASLYSLGFNSVERLVSFNSGALNKRIWEMLMKSVCLALCAAVFHFYPTEKLYRGIEEYDAAAENYLIIKNNFPFRDWTIIAPPEQLPQTIGYGWHMEILRFVQKYSLEQASDPKFDIPIPSRHVFLYTEKRPLHLDRHVTDEDALKELEPEGDDPFMQYYRNREQRAVLQAKAIKWMEEYRKTHPDVSVFYEDDNMRIYHIYHEPEKLKK